MAVRVRIPLGVLNNHLNLNIMSNYEKRHVATVIACSANLMAAAKSLSITLKTLTNMIIHDAELRSSICAAKRYYKPLL